MRRALAIGAVLAILAAGAGAYWFFASNGVSGPRTSAQGILVSATQGEFTISLRDGKTQTFTLPQNTPVYSYVKSRETAKTLSQLPRNSYVVVFLDHDNGSVLRVHVALPPLDPKLGAAFFGTIADVDGDSLTVAPIGEGAARTYELSDATEIISSALAGEVGKDAEGLIKGVRVSVFGESEATLIIIALPTGEEPQN